MSTNNTTYHGIHKKATDIGDTGVAPKSEALKINTTHTKLNIGGIDSRLMARFHRSLPLSQKCSTGNMLTKVGAASLLEALKTNTTLTSLNLNGEQTNHFF